MGDESSGKAARAILQITFVASTILATLFAAAIVGGAGDDRGRVAAIFPPWWSGHRAIEAAASAGDILGVGGARFVVILHGDPEGLRARARAAGALFTLSAAFAGSCTPLLRDIKS